VSVTLQGIGVSKGFAIGQVYIINRDPVEISEYALAKHEIEEEIARFETAIKTR